MTELPWTAKRYLSAVRRQLDAPPGDKEQLMERLHRAVSTYLEENETAGLDALAAAFGQPEVCAASLLYEINPVEVAAVRDRRKRRQRVAVGILAALVVLLTCFSLYLYSTGGLVIITQGTFTNPEDMPPPPESGTITFHYEYEDGD